MVPPAHVDHDVDMSRSCARGAAAPSNEHATLSCECVWWCFVVGADRFCAAKERIANSRKDIGISQSQT